MWRPWVSRAQSQRLGAYLQCVINSKTQTLVKAAGGPSQKSLPGAALQCQCEFVGALTGDSCPLQSIGDRAHSNSTLSGIYVSIAAIWPEVLMVSLQSASMWKLLNQLPGQGAASSSLLARQQSIKVSTAFVLLSVCWRGACLTQVYFSSSRTADRARSPSPD